MYKKILVAVDGNSTSDIALKEALKLAKGQTDTVVRLVYVLDLTTLMIGELALDVRNWIKDLKKKGEALLKKMTEQIKSFEISYESCLLELRSGEGSVAEKIITEAAECHADLLVLGTHGRRGFKRLLLGSVAENVIRQANIPILLIREEENNA